jgi:6-phosphogluconolactonase (cycloisomerase 2 family)
MAFHPSGKFSFTVMEMANYVVVHAIGSNAKLTEVQRISSLPSRKVFTGFSKAAEILMTADGKQLLVSNRGFGPDSGNVVVYPFEVEKGFLGVGVTSKIGDTFPR